MLSISSNGCYLSNDSSYIRFPYGEVNIIFHCMTLLIQVAYMFIQWFCASLSPPHTLTYMCFDNFDTVGSMRGHPMVVFHVSNCYWGWFWIQFDNENTSVCLSCVQVLLLVVAGRVSGVYY